MEKCFGGDIFDPHMLKKAIPLSFHVIVYGAQVLLIR